MRESHLHRTKRKCQRQERRVQKLLEAEANRRVRMYNLQSAKDYASVRTSLAIVQPVHKR
ncbi:hypothetical protein BDZ89DRAFT_1078756 [Hymenopellis radicata]|nr:hypothetical protein BDZ89DRAFT_1078756 [Hymenopellis radicata]